MIMNIFADFIQLGLSKTDWGPIWGNTNNDEPSWCYREASLASTLPPKHVKDLSCQYIEVFVRAVFGNGHRYVNSGITWSSCKTPLRNVHLTNVIGWTMIGACSSWVCLQIDPNLCCCGMQVDSSQTSLFTCPFAFWVHTTMCSTAKVFFSHDYDTMWNISYLIHLQSLLFYILESDSSYLLRNT